MYAKDLLIDVLISLDEIESSNLVSLIPTIEAFENLVKYYSTMIFDRRLLILIWTKRRPFLLKAAHFSKFKFPLSLLEKIWDSSLEKLSLEKGSTSGLGPGFRLISPESSRMILK